MISKIAPIMVMGMAAQSYYNKTKKGKKKMKRKEIGNMTKQEAQRAGISPSKYREAMRKASRKKKKSSLKGDIENMSQEDVKRAGIDPQEVRNARRKKAIQKAILKKRKKKGMSNSANTGDGTSAAQGKYGK